MALGAEIIDKARSLRRDGYSIPEISRSLGFAKSTASRITRGVAVSEEGQAKLAYKRSTSSVRAESVRNASKQFARTQLSSLSSRDLLLIAAVIYWAEGTKLSFSLINGDANMIRVFVESLRLIWGIRAEDLAVSLRMYKGQTRREVARYWSEQLGLEIDPENTYFEIIETGGKSNKLTHGMCRVRVRKPNKILKDLEALRATISEHVPVVQWIKQGTPNA